MIKHPCWGINIDKTIKLTTALPSNLGGQRSPLQAVGLREDMRQRRVAPRLIGGKSCGKPWFLSFKKWFSGSYKN
jgi:hypothetical protein